MDLEEKVPVSGLMDPEKPISGALMERYCNQLQDALDDTGVLDEPGYGISCLTQSFVGGFEFTEILYDTPTGSDFVKKIWEHNTEETQPQYQYIVVEVVSIIHRIQSLCCESQIVQAPHGAVDRESKTPLPAARANALSHLL